MANGSQAVAYLSALVSALDGAFISSWQSTAAWQAQLNEARDYLAALAQAETNEGES